MKITKQCLFLMAMLFACSTYAEKTIDTSARYYLVSCSSINGKTLETKKNAKTLEEASRYLYAFYLNKWVQDAYIAPNKKGITFIFDGADFSQPLNKLQSILENSPMQNLTRCEIEGLGTPIKNAN